MGFVVAERVLYTPSMGFCLALATFLVDGLALAAFVPLLEEEGLFEESFVSSSPPALPNDEAVAALDKSCAEIAADLKTEKTG